MACFWFEHVTDDLVKEHKKQRRHNVELDEKRSRVYVIRLVKGKMKGSFIFGRRRSPLWAGFGVAGPNTEDSSDE